jgi:hypothetical protein
VGGGFAVSRKTDSPELAKYMGIILAGFSRIRSIFPDFL